jgi:hypothetical protein
LVRSYENPAVSVTFSIRWPLFIANELLAPVFTFVAEPEPSWHE